MRSSSDGEDILGQKVFRGTEAKKDVVSFTLLDLEVASQETKGSIEEVGEPALIPKWILLTFWGTSVYVFYLFPFLSSSTRFVTN